MNATATRPEWLPLVEQCAAAEGAIDSLPSLADTFGAGAWRVEPGSMRADGLVLHAVYWVTGKRKNGVQFHRVGTFLLDVSRVRNLGRVYRNRCGALTVGYDAQGRQLVKVKIDSGMAGSDPASFNVMAIELELYRGVMLPRPVPAFGVEVQGN